MAPLTKKLLRDLWRIKSQAIAIAVVVAAGVAVFIASRGAYESLVSARDSFYESSRFADVFLHVERAPRRMLRDVQQVEGVEAVEGRVVANVSVEVAGMRDPAVGRLISLPTIGEPRLNRPHIRAGRLTTPASDREVVLAEAFAEAHALSVGDPMTLIVHGRRRTVRISGIAVSPEWVYQVKEGDFWPDDERFAVMWMRTEGLESALDMKGAWNDLSVRLAEGASSEEVIAEIDRITDGYGGLGAYGRDRQISHRMLSDELDGLRSSAILVPLVFVGIAVFLLRMVLARIVWAQRSQIAMLRAFGYRPGQIARHFLGLALAPVLFGCAAGVVVGHWLASAMTDMYSFYFRLPTLAPVIANSTVTLAIGSVAIASALAVLGTVRRASSVPPAEGMQPEAPATFHATLFDRLRLTRWLSSTAIAVLRQLSRRPWRAVASVTGLALSEAILVVGMYSVDSVGLLMDVEFRLAQRQQLTVTYASERPTSAHDAIARLPGVLRAEPFRMEGVTILSERATKKTALTGISRDAVLRRIVDQHGTHIELPPDGVVLSRMLAEDLSVRRGDVVTVERLLGDRSRHHAMVTEVVDDLLGSGASMDLDAMNRLLGSPRVSGAYLWVRPDQSQTLIEELRMTPGVASTVSRGAALRSFEKLMDESFAVMRLVQTFFALIIAVSIVTINARIALEERKRELASLRVLGFTRGAVASMLLGELALLTLLAIPVGLSMGYGLAWLVSSAYETDLYRFPLIIHRSTYAFAVFVLVVSTLVTSLFVRRRVNRLTLLEAVKTRE